MRWPSVESVAQSIPLPQDYKLELIRKSDVPAVVELLFRWYPDIEVGAESCHLNPEFYYEHVLLQETTEDRELWAIVIRNPVGQVVSFGSLEKRDDALTCVGRLGAICPTERSQGARLGMAGIALLEVVGRSMGAEMVYYSSTLKSVAQQIIAEKSGFQLVGIMPAYDRDMVAKGEVKRVFEATYAKVLVSEDKIFFPPEEVLTPRTREVWEVLFGQQKISED